MRRNRTEQLIAILEACDHPVGLKTSHVGYRSALNCPVTYSLIRFLVEQKLLDKVYPMQKRLCRQSMKHPVFKTTEEGKRVVRLYREVEKALELKV